MLKAFLKINKQTETPTKNRNEVLEEETEER